MRLPQAIGLFAVAVFTLGCFGGDESRIPPPNHVASVGAACSACAPDQAVHQCAPRVPGQVDCQGIPVAVVGDSMINELSGSTVVSSANAAAIVKAP